MRTDTLRVILLIGVFTPTFCANFGVNVHVAEKMTWSEAREYCRKYFTDLTSIISKEEGEELILGTEANATTNSNDNFTFNNSWIGLYKNVHGTWSWSGGNNALFPLWKPLQEQGDGHSCVMLIEKGWQTINCEKKLPFYCFQSSLVLVQVKKTWEEALGHCGSLNMQLVSLISDSALNKALQTSRTALTAQVWTGLRYLGDSWLWVDGICTGQAGCQGGMPLCPTPRHHCGVLSAGEQQLDSWDCADKLNFICY